MNTLTTAQPVTGKIAGISSDGVLPEAVSSKNTQGSHIAPERSNPWYNAWTFQTSNRLCQLVPRPLIRGLARVIGLLAHDLCDEARDLMRDNLRIATGRSGPALDDVCRSTFMHFIEMLADTLRFMGGNRADAWHLIENWSGLEYLEASRQRGKGTLLVTGHLGAWELGGILLAVRDIPVTVVTLAEPHPELGAWRERYRDKFNIRTITLGDDKFAFVEIVQTLRENGIVALLFDRPYGENAIPVNFCGRKTFFSPAPALLHQHTGATILPAFVFALPSGKYASHLYPPIPMRNAETRVDRIGIQHANTQLLADFLEDLLQQNPGQWYNYVRIWN